MEGLELSSRVSTRTAYTSGSADAKYRVALIDLGVKRNIIQSLVERGCYVQVFPMKTSFAEIKRWNPDGFMISNGPGDPGVMPDEIKLIKEIMNSNIPTFGICLGHQLIAEACGIATYKMKNGHRGINHPVKNMISGKSEITSQNHGFSVKSEDVKGNAELEITHVNLNDGTIEGLRHKTKDVFCVQYHPESTPGPLDSRYLFDQFVELMAKVKIKKPSTGIAV
jgi:carbamoyl-phosphate synthase small subunit